MAESENKSMTVLFIGSDVGMVHGFGEGLSVRVVRSGEEGMAVLEAEGAEVVVVDMVGGEGFLRVVHQRFPGVVRIAMVAEGDGERLMKDVGLVHMCVRKPCDPERLLGTLSRTARIMGGMRRAELRKAVGLITSLPPLPETYQTLLSELRRPDASAARVGQIVAEDPALSAKMLQLVNSAFFGLPRQLTSPAAAVSMLGLKTVHGIVVSGRIFETLCTDSQRAAVIGDLWLKSLMIGQTARDYAQMAGLSLAEGDLAHLTGMFSLMGRAVLGSVDMPYFSAIKRSGKQSMEEAELGMFGITQESVGAYALGVWGFADEVVEVVAHQATPGMSTHGGAVLAAVHLARCVHGTRGREIVLDVDFLSRSGLKAEWLDQSDAA